MDTNLTAVEQAQYAAEIQKHIANLHARVGEILDPLIERLLDERDVDQIRAVAGVLPKGGRSVRLMRAAREIEEGCVPKGRRPNLRRDQIELGARVVYSDTYLTLHEIFSTSRELRRSGEIVGHMHYTGCGDPAAAPVENGFTCVHVRWDDGMDASGYLRADYDQVAIYNLSRA